MSLGRLARLALLPVSLLLAPVADARAEVVILAQQGPRLHPEEAAVRVPLEAYLKGHETGDTLALRRAFAKEARLWWVREGMVATRTTDEYIADAGSRTRTRDTAQHRRIVSLEITGESAVATIEIEYPTVRFTDHMSLAKVGDEWRIISKAFFAEPRIRVM